jgi:hypothetical protein
MPERITVDRLTLADSAGRHFHLTEPTFIDAGQTYWIDRSNDELCVDRGNGRISRHPGSTCRGS